MGVSRAETQEGVQWMMTASAVTAHSPDIPHCVAWCVAAFFSPLLSTEDCKKQKKSVPCTKYVTSPSSHWHTLHFLKGFSLLLCPYSQSFQPSIPADRQGASLQQGGHRTSACLLLEGLQFVFHVSNFSGHKSLLGDLEREAASLGCFAAGPSQVMP